MIKRIQYFFEMQTFGVCAWWGESLNVKTESIRLSFIYLSFLTLGSPILFYLIMAFVLEHKERIKRPFRKRRTVWEL